MQSSMSVGRSGYTGGRDDFCSEPEMQRQDGPMPDLHSGRSGSRIGIAPTESVTIPKAGASKLLGALWLRARAVQPPGVERRLCPRQNKSARKAVDDLQGS